MPRAFHLSPTGCVLTLLSMIMSHPPLSAAPLARYLPWSTQGAGVERELRKIGGLGQDQLNAVQMSTCNSAPEAS